MESDLVPHSRVLFHQLLNVSLSDIRFDDTGHARVFSGENWNPDLQAPLTQPGVNVAAGEYLLAVNGRNLTANDNVYSFFEATAGKQTVIRAGPDPSGANSREVTVVPLASDLLLRNLAWIEANRRRVEQLSKGQVGYVYVPDTGINGQDELVRMWRAQVTKPGLVIDERFNSGGQMPDRFIELLNRPLRNYWAVRDGRDWTTPWVTHLGPKAMLMKRTHSRTGPRKLSSKLKTYRKSERPAS